MYLKLIMVKTCKAFSRTYGMKKNTEEKSLALFVNIHCVLQIQKPNCLFTSHLSSEFCFWLSWGVISIQIKELEVYFFQP